ncbi:MAG: glycosyltransferase family protein, partial [Limisphaerales bacterium]
WRLSAWEPPAHDAPLTFAFAGTLHGPYRALLETLARELASSGHRLLLHSPDAHLPTAGPADRAITDAGWVPPSALAATLRAEADVLFLPMSFLRADRSNMRVAFPSKLAEYCAAGRPVLVWGPAYCSACRWAKAHAGFAEVVDTLSISDLRQALARLSADPHRRRRMGQESLRLALQFFSHEKTFATFIAALSNSGMRSQTHKPNPEPVDTVSS